MTDEDDEPPTNVYDSQRLRSKKPTERGSAPGPGSRPRSPTARRRESLESIATPTAIVHNRSEPIRVISMKTPAEIQPKLEVKLPVVRLRALADVTPIPGSSSGIRLGRLAPPRDPKEVRARRLREYLLWGSVVMMVSCLVMLAIWFLARR
ncbi:MAG: hypothetical protein ABI867_45500 [Kofleriaceae bacterium]